MNQTEKGSCTKKKKDDGNGGQNGELKHGREKSDEKNIERVKEGQRKTENCVAIKRRMKTNRAEKNTGRKNENVTQRNRTDSLAQQPETKEGALEVEEMTQTVI